MQLSSRLKIRAKSVQRDGVTLWFAARHPQAPWYAKALGFFVMAYALTRASPIDLIPDFIPVVGYLDDVLLLPGLIVAVWIGACLALGHWWMRPWLAVQELSIQHCY
ncbi:MAG: DUF1232 domain-containing protein [Comamonadaceae bacterium]|nr:DUF1232 domain-containing protein [Comamonadaceae bacterium]